MAELDFISKFSGEEIDNILDKSQELLNKGYTFSGVATPETDPGTPSIKVFYLTTTAGKYANFDNITVESGKLTVLLYNGSMWQNQVLDLPTSSEPEVNVVQTIGNSTTDVMSQNAVTEELSKKASVESVTDGISAHNTSSTSHADIRNLLNTCVGLPAYDSSSYKITFTTLAGASVEIDLPIEQLALRYNAETESIEFDNADGTTTSIPVSAFVKEYVGSIGDRIQISIDENNAIHATVLKNSIDWDCLSVELQERINDHVTSVDFATKVVRTDIAQPLSLAAQNQALENIGADLMVIDLVNGQATLTDEQEARLLSCKGVILRGTVNAGKEVLTKIYFSDYQGGDQVSFWAVKNNEYILQCVYTKSTKLFRFLTSAGFIDRNAVSIKKQTLNATQQEQAWSNLGLDLVVLKFPEGVTSVTLTDEQDAKLAAGAAILVTVEGPGTGTGISDADNHIFTAQSFAGSQAPLFFSLRSNSLGLYAVYNKNNKTFTYNGSLFLVDGGAVRFNEKTKLTSSQQDVALSNIGLDFVHVDYSLLGTTLDASTAALVENAKGIVLTNTPENYSKAFVFLKAVYSNNAIYFNAWNGISLVSQFSYNISTKRLTAISGTDLHFDSVRYTVDQGLTDAQKQQARTNIGVQSADELLEDADFIAKLKTKLGMA